MANPSKVKAITDLKPPKTLKEIQSLNEKLATLSRFLSMEAEKTHPVKGKILADFIVKTPSEKEGETKDKKPLTKNKVPTAEATWKLNTDGALIFDCFEAGLMLLSLKRKEFTYALRFEFKTTTNEVEYEALLAGLRIASDMEIKELAIFVDS
ncbi:reverse transcriptase domain-containing protein [Tanacetum coccineum]